MLKIINKNLLKNMYMCGIIISEYYTERKP